MEPVSVVEVYNEFLNTDLEDEEKYANEKIYSYVCGLIGRIRKKLGQTAVVTVEGEGYVTRNNLIKEQVEKGLSEIDLKHDISVFKARREQQE